MWAPGQSEPIIEVELRTAHFYAIVACTCRDFTYLTQALQP